MLQYQPCILASILHVTNSHTVKQALGWEILLYVAAPNHHISHAWKRCTQNAGGIAGHGCADCLPHLTPLTTSAGVQSNSDCGLHILAEAAGPRPCNAHTRWCSSLLCYNLQ